MSGPEARFFAGQEELFLKVEDAPAGSMADAQFVGIEGCGHVSRRRPASMPSTRSAESVCVVSRRM
jgi:hypothetical protein